MTDDRDHDLARRLAELRTPEHGPGFWTDLRAGIDGVVELRPHRHRPRSPNSLLVAAAVVLVALVSAGVVLRTGGDDDAAVGTDPTVTEPSPDTTLDGDDAGPAVTEPLRPDGEPAVRGEGRPVAVDPTGTFLYVAAPDPDGGRGCEGAPAEALFVERVDGDGSDRRLAVDRDLVDATGGVEVRFAGRAEIALVPRCEGFGADVVTGGVAADGTVAEPTQLSVPGATRIADIAFSDTGLLIAAVETAGPDGVERSLVQFPASPSEPSDLGEDGVVALDTIVGRRLVTAAADGTIRAEGRVVAEVPRPVELVLSPSGSLVVVRTEDAGLVAVDLEAGPVSTLGVGPTTGPLSMPDAGTVVFVRDDGQGLVVTSLDLSSGDVQALAATGTGEYALGPDADVVFVPRFPDDPEQPPALLGQRLSR